MKWLLSFSFLFYYCFLYSQSVFAPLGTTWNYQFQDGSGGYSGPKSFWYEKDTLIQGELVKKINSAYFYTIVGPQGPLSGTLTEYLLERNDSVFEYNIFDQSKQLIYSFNQNVGDTFHHSYFSLLDTILVKLDSIGFINICGHMERINYYSQHEVAQNGMLVCNSNYSAVEHYGVIDTYLFINPKCVIDGPIYTFECMNTGTCIYPQGVCSALSIKDAATEELILKLLINGYFFHSSKLIKSLRIFNTAGQELCYVSINSNEYLLNKNGLQSGVYILEIELLGSKIYKKIVF